MNAEIAEIDRIIEELTFRLRLLETNQAALDNYYSIVINQGPNWKAAARQLILLEKESVYLKQEKERTLRSIF